MKNVTKILTAVTLCAALFASEQRISALGGNAALWPGDEANIAAFPAQVNNHSFVQIDGVGAETGETTNGGGISLLTNVDGTAWGFNYGSDDWVNMSWGNGTMGVTVGMESTTGATAAGDKGAMSVAYGNTFDWGEIGVKYTTSNDDYTSGTAMAVDATLAVNYRSDFGFWLFDNTVVSAGDLMDDDLAFDADFFTHMDAGGADVVYGWGLSYDAAGAGANMATMTQTATIGVEANMTDWATLRVGYNWSHELACDGATDACGANGGDGYAFGLGFNWGGLTADFTVDSDLLQDPIGTITGYGDGGLTDSQITLTYSF